MNVKPYEGLHRFLVTSDGTDPDMEDGEYLVDLAEEGGIGRCGCRNWECRISPRITQGQKPIDLCDPLFTCKHIEAAREYQYQEWFWLVLALEQHEPT